MIHCVVDAEESVVDVLERIDGDGAVLCIVALQVEGKLLGDVVCKSVYSLRRLVCLRRRHSAT